MGRKNRIEPTDTNEKSVHLNKSKDSNASHPSKEGCTTNYDFVHLFLGRKEQLEENVKGTELSTRIVKKNTRLLAEELPIGIEHINPEIIYTLNVKNSFDRLECVKERYSLK